MLRSNFGIIPIIYCHPDLAALIETRHTLKNHGHSSYQIVLYEWTVLFEKTDILAAKNADNSTLGT